jgi:hypothetical protein
MFILVTFKVYGRRNEDEYGRKQYSSFYSCILGTREGGAL